MEPTLPTVDTCGCDDRSVYLVYTDGGAEVRSLCVQCARATAAGLPPYRVVNLHAFPDRASAWAFMRERDANGQSAGYPSDKYGAWTVQTSFLG